MSSISSIGSSSTAWATQGMQGMHKNKRPSATEMADQAFSALDSSGKGYIDKADLQTMVQKLGTSSTSSTSQASNSTSGVDKLFSALDADGSGQVTKQEFTDAMQKIADQLDQQRHSSKMQNAISQAGLDGAQGMGGPGGPGGMPPPGGAGGPKGDGDGDGGMTKEQMTSKLSETGSSDSQLSSLLSNTLKNFEAADSNQDGKVSADEAMAYQKAHPSESETQTGSSTGNSSGATAANSSGLSSAQVVMQVSRLFEAYIANNSDSASASSLSVSA